MRCLILALAVINFVRANDDCHYPFVARGVTYTEGLCADGYWCSKTENWDTDHQSVYNCKTDIELAIPDAAVSDVETTVEGVFCTFPFHYRGVIYEECIGTGSSAWCSLTADYSADYKRGYCKQECHYPFVARGRTYNEGECVDQYWCSTTANYDTDHSYIQCTPVIGGIESDIATTGGNAQGANCVFPFMSGRQLYDDCKMGWCATTENYDTDRKFGYCPRPLYIAPVAVAVEDVAEEVVEEEVEVAVVDEVEAVDEVAVVDAPVAVAVEEVAEEAEEEVAEEVVEEVVVVEE